MDLSKQASGILNIFDIKDLFTFIKDTNELIELYLIDDELNKEMQKHLTEDIDKLRLIRTAMLLSKIADKHATKLKKVSQRYPNFNEQCLKLVRRDNAIQIESPDAAAVCY